MAGLQDKDNIEEIKEDIVGLVTEGVLPVPACARTINFLDSDGLYPLRSRVFYKKQIEVLLEKKYYHWRTHKAIGELINEKKLRATPYEIDNIIPIFVSDPSHRYIQREITEKASTIAKYSNYKVTNDIGRHAEATVLQILETDEFRLYNKKGINEYKGRKWKTDDNLDFIVEKNGIGIGIEIKNTLDYIPQSEFRLKMDMCDFLKIKPLFVARYAPSSYIHEIYERGGRYLLTKTQIYHNTSDYKLLVSQIWEELALPVACHDYISLRNTKIHNLLLSMANKLI